MTEHDSTEPQDVLTYWENYLEEQRQKIATNADELQTLVNELGLVEAGVNPMDPMFKLENIPSDAVAFLEQEFDTDLRATDEAIREASNIARKDKPTKQRRPMQRI